MLDNPYFLAVGVVLFMAFVADVIREHRRMKRARKQRAEMIRLRVMENLRVMEIGPAEVINLREIIEG